MVPVDEFCAAPSHEGDSMLGLRSLGFLLLAVAAGASFVVQQAVNADLRASLNSAAWAGFASYLGGTICMVALAAAMREGLPTAANIAESHWWAWSGGLFGAIYIAISILLLPRIGAATFVALLVAGQMLTSLVFDHYGLFGVPRHPVDLTRMAGGVLLVSGAVLVRL
jgi:transporter family-2 protein